MRERLKIERHEAMYGPHFNEECALKAVSKMENEDGSRGEHWSLEETTSIANQYGINLKGEKYNKYDWYVALNMIRSDYYRAVVTMTSSDHIKYFVELAKAWLNDKDIEEGKMWYYYCYIMCDKLRKEAKTMLMLEDDEDEEREYRYARGGRGRGRGRGGRMTHYGYDYDENANLASQLANCCCQTQRSIDSVNLNLTQMSADNKLSICQQTNTLQNAITGGFNNLLTDNTNKFNVIGAKIDAQTQMINDKFCQLEMREMQNKIDTLRAEKSALELGLSQSAQTANIVNQLRPCPVPAYLTCNPFGCNGGFTGYGYGYNDGCGCGC
nr:MAG: hypothetical protein [Bacteriophage sp.]